MKNLCEGEDTGKMSGEEWHHPAFISVSGRHRILISLHHVPGMEVVTPTHL